MGLFDRIENWLRGAGEGQGPLDDRELHLAAAILLFGVARADHRLEPAELERLRGVLGEYWGLDGPALDELMEVAGRESDASASLHRQLEVLNARLSAEEKFRLMEGLWAVACADGEIHHYEEHLVRRLADLLYVPHSEFIRAKHRVLARREPTP